MLFVVLLENVEMFLLVNNNDFSYIKRMIFAGCVCAL